jgi:hypothetical protein
MMAVLISSRQARKVWTWDNRKRAEGQRLQLVAPFDFWFARSRPTPARVFAIAVLPGFGLA